MRVEFFHPLLLFAKRLPKDAIMWRLWSLSTSPFVAYSFMAQRLNAKCRLICNCEISIRPELLQSHATDKNVHLVAVTYCEWCTTLHECSHLRVLSSVQWAYFAISLHANTHNCAILYAKNSLQIDRFHKWAELKLCSLISPFPRRSSIRNSWNGDIAKKYCDRNCCSIDKKVFLLWAFAEISLSVNYH